MILRGWQAKGSLRRWQRVPECSTTGHIAIVTGRGRSRQSATLEADVVRHLIARTVSRIRPCASRVVTFLNCQGFEAIFSSFCNRYHSMSTYSVPATSACLLDHRIRLCSAERFASQRIWLPLTAASTHSDLRSPGEQGYGGTHQSVSRCPAPGRNAKQAKSLPLSRRGGLVRHAHVAHR
jgi:hypothetical protein